jgi:Arc/MetJ family transcription regulator
MIGLRCLHGMDTRFCSLCNRRPQVGKDTVQRGHVDDASLAEIIRFLNHEQVRATYGAVAKVLGAIPRTMGAKLGPRCVEASWIVSTATRLPTDYEHHQMHPALQHKVEIIATGRELARRLSAWKASQARAAAADPVEVEGQS